MEKSPVLSLKGIPYKEIKAHKSEKKHAQIKEHLKSCNQNTNIGSISYQTEIYRKRCVEFYWPIIREILAV
jgi:hypothetical protein